jgi:hypothetical protein
MRDKMEPSVDVEAVVVVDVAVVAVLSYYAEMEPLQKGLLV